MSRRGPRADLRGTRTALALAVALSACATDTSADAETQLRDAFAEVPGSYAIAYKNLATGKQILVNAEEKTHAASLMKLPVMMAVFAEVDAGNLSLDQPIPIQNTFYSMQDGSEFQIDYNENTLLGQSAGKSLRLRELIEEMIQASDNLATNILLTVVHPDRVQELVIECGATNTFVRRGVEDIKAYRAGISNETDARGMLLLLEKCYRGDGFSNASRDHMLRILRGQRIDSMIRPGLPVEFDGTVANKTGSISWVHHDAGIVEPAANEPYAVVILTHGFGDERKKAIAAGQAASQILYTVGQN